MDKRCAEENLDLIRQMMEKSVRYEILSARAGLQVGFLGILGATLSSWYGVMSPERFVIWWGTILLASLGITGVQQYREVREAGSSLWSKPARQVALSLLPAFVAAIVLTVHAFAHGRHLELPSVWMLCYGCGVLGTRPYAPSVVLPLGAAFLFAGALTAWLGPAHGNLMMGLAFGVGHVLLGITLIRQEEPRPLLRLVPTRPSVQARSR